MNGPKEEGERIRFDFEEAPTGIVTAAREFLLQQNE